MPLPPIIEPAPALTPTERERTARHLRLPELGDVGQRRLAAARVAVIGAGGLGSPILLYLAAAGVGTIAIIDDDLIDASNLHRQVLHAAGDVGQPKVTSAARRMREAAPEVTVVDEQVRLTEHNARSLLAEYDLVLDGTDNFATRYLVADTCADLGLPLVWGSVLRFDAQVSVFWSTPPTPARPARLRDLFPSPPAPGEVPSCADAGVLGALCGMVGSMMAMEAIKLITGIGEVLLGRVAVVDALTMRVTEVPFQHQVPDGVPHPSPLPAPSGGVAVEQPRALTADALRGDVCLLDVREPDEFAIDPLPGARNLPVAVVETTARQGREALERLLGDPIRPVVAYCAAGIRAKRAAGALTGLGFEAGYLPPEIVTDLRRREDARAGKGER